MEFVIDIPETERILRIDTSLLTKVIGNLLSNAKKYNKAGEVISVNLLHSDKGLTIAISDDGEAIDETFVLQMFNAFSRADKARKTDGGTGLGLAISKIIVEKYGGFIEYIRKDNNNIFMVQL